MCPSRATCLHVDIELSKSNSECCSSTKQISSSSYQKVTSSCHDMAGRKRSLKKHSGFFRGPKLDFVIIALRTLKSRSVH